MNKSVFLNLVLQQKPISQSETEALEALAENFPYCQTAHLLLAKAAYDQGSMLSNQKLRRAAAYATNRQLLKKLIYTTTATVTLQPVLMDAEEAEIPVPSESPKQVFTPEILVAFTETIAKAIPEVKADTDPGTEEVKTQEVAKAVISDEIPLTAAEAAAVPFEAPEIVAVQTETDEVKTVEIPLTAAEASATSVAEIESNQPVSENSSEAEPETLTEQENKDSVDEELARLLVIDQILHDPDLFAERAAEIIDEEKAEIGEQPTEADAIVPEKDTFDQQPEQEQETLSDFDQYLFKPEREKNLVNPEEDLQVSYPEDISRKIYEEDIIGYWMNSSRLGECLQPKEDWTTHSQPYDFHPELLLEYNKEHPVIKTIEPSDSILSQQLDIIDQFLKQNPRLKTMANAKNVRTEPLEDLSSKSTKIKKDMASENLAHIFMQQGKIKKAIKIYEHLILKIPEKKAYFVAQIEKLQNTL